MIITTIQRRFECLIVCFLILAAIGLSSTYLIQPAEHFDADEAIVGLMARHILKGHIPAYFYGQGYMGSMEAMVAAGYFAVFGSSVFTLKLAPLTFYILFLIIQYRLIRYAGGVALALTTLAITVVFSNTMILWAVKARGGFTETLFWGTLAYTLFFRLMDGYFRSGRKGWRMAFLLGLTIGIGFWNCSMAAYYYLPIALYLIIFGTAEIKKRRKDNNRSAPVRRRQPARWRIALRRCAEFIIPVVGIYLVFGLITAIQGEIEIPVFGIEIGSHHGGRDLIRGLSILILVIAALTWERTGFKKPLDRLRQFQLHYPITLTASVIIITFLLITAGINIYFQQLPDYYYGHYQPHGPVVNFHKIGDNISLLFTRLLPKVIGVSYSSFKLDLGRSWPARYSGVTNGLTLAASGIFVISLILIRLARRRSFPEFIRNNRLNIFFLTSLVGCFFAMSLSSQIKDSTAYRYLIPVISWLPFFLASLCVFLWRKSKAAGILLAFLIIGAHSVRLAANLPLPAPTDPEPTIPYIIKSLRDEKVTRAYINYWLAYPITFITGEEIIAAPYRSHDRYPPYTRAVDKSPEVAYVFKGYKQIIGKRQENRLITNQTPYRKIRYRWGYLLITGSGPTRGDER